MAELAEEDERDAVDHLTNAMFSVSFLHEISSFWGKTGGHGLTVGQFIGQWNQQVSPKELKVPMSPGVLLGLMYLGIVYGKELWFDQIPDVPLSDTDESWGSTRVECMSAGEPRPTLRYVVRRLRNALSHGRVRIVVPQGLTRETMFRGIKVRFTDENRAKKGDTFVAEMSLEQITKFIWKFQSVVHKHVRMKYGIAAE